MESQDITGCSDDTKDSIESLKESDSYTDAEGDNTFSEMIEIPKKGLSDIDKTVLQAMTGWSDKIIDSIGSFEEARIYIKADLKEVTVNDKPCLIKKDIDMSQKDEMGRTNEQRMEKGLAPLDKNGNSLELHHIGQKKDSPLAELTKEEHRGIGNDAILHDKTKDSEINRNEFNTERKNHWKDRLECTTND
ncbi:hypothetical protein CBF31_06835 [Vagococcus fessus]|uniref:LHH domain-containing protein n=2 Tax=Vagococcus fessus TaxID=120370 RepID=A0A430A9E8_9ENTE|nr:hypothetical protein CBF31_06835 [Vagococcus fessus]